MNYRILTEEEQGIKSIMSFGKLTQVKIEPLIVT